MVSNLLHSARLPELLEQLRNEFDNVVIDTPPALHHLRRAGDRPAGGRGAADRPCRTDHAGCGQMVKQRFGEDGTPLLGTILNGWDPKHDVYGYKYRYYNGSGSYTKEVTSEQNK